LWPISHGLAKAKGAPRERPLPSVAAIIIAPAGPPPQSADRAPPRTP